MKIVSKILSAGVIFAFLASCTCGVPLKVTPIQADDKKLACKDVILEINEAEHYRDEGAEAAGISFGEALMPVCWVSGYIDGSQAKKSANARIDYLGRIYDLLECGGTGADEDGEERSSFAPPPPPMAAVAVPMVAMAAKQPQNYSPPAAQENLSVFNSKEKQTGSARMHEHRDKNSRMYMHSHPYSVPHVHPEDLPSGDKR